MKDILSKYNERAVGASSGQADMFSSNSREDILKDVLGLARETPRGTNEGADAPPAPTIGGDGRGPKDSYDKTDILGYAEHLAKRDEVKRMAAHFPEETPDEAAAFDKRVPEMSDEELLAYMEADGHGDVNKAHHPSVYDEYDARHDEEYTAYMHQTDEAIEDILSGAESSSGPVASQEETDAIQRIADMLDEAERRWADGGSRSDERTALMAQMDTLNEWLDRNVREHRADKGVTAPLNEAETALRNAVVKVLNGMGIKTHLSERGQMVLDRDRERQANLMGSRVERRKKKIDSELQGRVLTSVQQDIVDVFTGKRNNVPIDIVDGNGTNRHVVMRQGEENKAGTKHSIFGHYDTSSGGYTSEEILLIPDIIKNGTRRQNGSRVAYELKDNGNTYTVTTEQSKQGNEVFTNFYTDRKQTAVVNGTSNTANQHVPQQSVSGTKLQKVPEYDKEETEKIFGAAKERFGTTQDMREAGYILPDGTMLDFTGRHQVDKGHDTSFLNGRRSVDHRDIKQLNYEADGNTESGLNVSMEDFVGRGAVRIDANAGVINLSARPTKAQRDMISRLIRRNGGDVSLEIGMDGEVYAEYDGASAAKVLADIDRYFDEGIKPQGDIRYFRTKDGQAYGFTLNGEIYLDPRIATAETPVHEYGHLWSEALREANPKAWEQLKKEMFGQKDVLDYVQSLYPELKGDELAEEVFTHFAGKRGAERLRAEQKRMLDENATDTLEQSRIMQMFNKLRNMLSAFWQKARDLFAGKVEGIENVTGDQFADMILSDLVGGFNPNEAMAEVKPQPAEEREGRIKEQRGADEDIRFRTDEEAPVFVSNARRAVEGIKQEKATPEQWLAMIEKQGGLKAGEDKWLGLSEWLKEQARRKNDGHSSRTLTKQEVLDYIRENQIEVEEVEYTEHPAGFEELKKEYDGWLREEGYDYAQEQLRERFGDDAEIAFDDVGGELVISNGDAASVLLGSEKPINETRLSYTTEGLENKREIALTVPSAESWNESDEVHFGDADYGTAVAWIRFGEYNRPFDGRPQKTDLKVSNGPVGYVVKFPDGHKEMVLDAKSESDAIDEAYRASYVHYRGIKKILVIDEIQSKRHQEGREKGYRTAEAVAEEERLRDAVNEAQEAYDEYTHKMGEKYDGAYEDIYADMTDGERAEADRLEQEVYDASERLQNHNVSGIPDAPFEKNWHELAMKRMLRYAAENGFDKVAWTTGEQQAERYNIGDAVERIISYDFPETADADGRKSKKIEIRLKNSETMTMRVDQNGKVIEGRSDTEGKMLSDVVGKELARSILNGEGRDGSIYDANRDIPAKVIDGEGLRIGGEGMKGFYDEMLPRFMNKYGKKWGVKAGEVELPDIGGETATMLPQSGRKGLRMWSVDVTPEMRESVMEGQVMFRFSDSKEDFDAMREEAIANKGLVMPGLAEKEVKVVSVPKHDFEGTGKEALQQAEAWAKENIVGTHRATDSEGKEFEYSIGNKAVEKYVSPSSTKGSENLGVHLSVLKKLPEVISNSIEAEVHPDYVKGEDGVRAEKNGINDKVLIHRFYGAVDIDGEIYRVKTTIKEHQDPNRANKPHDYEVTKIELVEDTPNSSWHLRGDNNHALAGAKLLQGVEKSYDKGKNLLDESEKTAMFRESEDEMLDRLVDEMGYFAALARKTMKGGGYSKAQRETYARAEWRRAHRNAKGVMEKLHIADDIVVVDSADQIPAGVPMSAKKRAAKGWYDTKTGKIYVILGNHLNSADVTQTLFHEAVAHYGLRKLFGSHFDTFLDSVLENVTPEIRQKILDNAAKNNWSTREAVEEYLASLAEDGSFKDFGEAGSGLWDKIKRLFTEMLRDLGLGQYLGSELSDNELRYILWRSYKNLEEPGYYNSPFSLAEDIAMQHSLAVGNYGKRNVDNIMSSGRIDMSGWGREVADGDRFRTSPEIDKQAGGLWSIEHTDDVESYGAENVRTKYGLKGSSNVQYAHKAEEVMQIAEYLPEEDAKTLRKFYLDGETKAYYSPTLDLVIVFAEKCESADDAELAEWHEQTHGNFNHLNLPNKDDLANEILNFLAIEYPDAYRHITDNYEEKDWKKEAVSYFVEETIRRYGVENFLGGEFAGNEKVRILADEIRNTFKNGYNYEETSNQRGRSNEVDGRKTILPEETGLRGGPRDGVEYDERGNRRVPQETGRSSGAGETESELRSVARNRNNAPGLGNVKTSSARANYEAAQAKASHRAKETTQDSMQAVKDLQTAVIGETGGKLLDTQNAWMAENRLSSANKAQIDEFKAAEMKSLLKAVEALGGKNAKRRAEISRYLMAKHGLERNRVFEPRDGRKDYSGLTSMFGESDVDAAEQKARDFVDDFEANNDAQKVADLWDAVRDVSGFTLRKALKSGLMSEESFNEISGQFQFYVPLRGWSETTTDEMYGYFNQHSSPLGNPIKRAEGRSSEADDPIANLQNVAEGAIISGNRNLVKQHFLNLAVHHRTSLMSVSEGWLKYKTAKDSGSTKFGTRARGFLIWLRNETTKRTRSL